MRPSSTGSDTHGYSSGAQGIERRALIQCVGVSKAFQAEGRQLSALLGVELEIGRGEFVVLVGRSGCGKTTLLKIIGGLQQASSGKVLIDGQEVQSPPREVGFVFQNSTLFPWRNVLDNVMLPVETYHLDRAKYHRRALELLSLMGLEEFVRHYPSQLSGGMAQRASIARSLLHEPSILLMDEPFASLDAMTREQLNLELLSMWAKTGSTIVFVTHNIAEAVLLGQRVVVMTPRPGKIRKLLQIDLAQPRSLGMLTSGEFNDHVAEVRRHLDLT